jgi:hypothetical protein
MPPGRAQVVEQHSLGGGTGSRPAPVVTGIPPSRSLRLIAAVVIGAALFALYLLYTVLHPEAGAGDFDFPLRAARHLAAGRDPYVAMAPGTVGAAGAFLYPLPAAFVAVPFAALPPAYAGAAFVGVSGALLAFALSARGWWRLLALMSPAFLLSFSVANWPPLIMASALIPGLGWLAAAKPNLGVVAFAYRPRWSTIVAGIVVIAASLVLVPGWPAGWLSHVARQEIAHTPTFAWPLGAVGLAGLLRWRTPEGRALAAFALVPVSVFPYDHLMLWLIPRNFREALLLTWTAWIAAPAVLGFNAEASHTTLLLIQAGITLGTVVPATFLVLRHPNTGPVPPRIERLVSCWPHWARGSA